MASYYISNSGNDSNAGTSSGSPWQTISKLNSSMGSFNAGDTIYFNRGDRFTGALTVTKSGSSGNPITFDAYGSGNDPIITTFTLLTSWSNLGGNKWSKTLPTSFSKLRILTANDVFTPIGRWPKITDTNSGYLTITSFTGNSSVTASSGGLSGYNFTGGEVVIRKQHWVIDVCPITSHSSNTINYTGVSSYNSQNGYGFFIQNHVDTLTAQNEWAYNSGTNTLTIYSTSNPDGLNVRVPTAENLVTISTQNYISFRNLVFEGSNQDLFNFYDSNNITIQDCTLRYAGYNAVYGELSENVTIDSCNIYRINNNGIHFHSNSHNVTITDNDIDLVGGVAGMGGSGDGKYFGIEVDRYSDFATISYNRISNIGYNGIGFHGNGHVVSHNFVQTFNFIKDDGAGIYSFVGPGSGTTFSNRRTVAYNIVINGQGAPNGTNSTNSQAHGIYMDDNVSEVDIENNTITLATQSGLYLHNAHHLTVRYNTIYNNTGADVCPEVWFMNDNLTTSNINSITFTNNVCVKTNSWSDNTWVLDMRSHNSNVNGFGTLNNNIYARPFHSPYYIFTSENFGSSGTDNAYNLSGWKSSGRGYDSSSTELPTSIDEPSDIILVYNDQYTTQNVALPPGSYVDMSNTPQSGTISLDGMKGVLLIYTGVGTTTTTTSTSTTTSTTIFIPAIPNGVYILYRE